MPLNDIIFVKGQGGLGRPLTGEDHISGLILYGTTVPSGFATTATKVVYSVSDAEALGIVADYSDATSAYSTIEITAIGNDGDTVVIKVVEPDKTVTIASYTKVSGDSTAGAVAIAIESLINAGTVNHGYTATSGGTVVNVVAPKKLGVWLNSNSCDITNTGDISAVTDVTFNGGVASQLAVQHYHISEFFRLQPKGILWVHITENNPTDYSEIATVQNASGGKVRQVAIYRRDSLSGSGELATIQGICDALDAVHKPVSSVLVGSDIVGVDLDQLANLAELNAPKVSAVIGQDAGGLGKYLYDTNGVSMTCVGAVLGAVALATVSQDIAWKGKFNFSNGTECDTVGFANGQEYNTVAPSQVDALCNYRYIFLVKNVGSAGSFANDSYTAVAPTSDYCFIENNRTIDKAIRGVYASLLPEIGAPIQLNADGTISDITINHLKSVAVPNLDQMVRDSDLSNYSVDINPTQDVLATSKIIVSVNLLPKGVSRVIQVNIGFVTSI